MSNFNEVLAVVSTVVRITPYDPVWENGSGHFNQLAMQPPVQTPLDKPAWSVDPSGRRIFWIGGAGLGNLVWFDLYSDNSGRIASNMPKGVKSLSPGMQELVFDAIHIKGLVGFSEALELILAIKVICHHPMAKRIAAAML